MDSSIAKQLIDKIYEKRKAAALDLEKQIRECHQQGEDRKIAQIIDQLVDMFSNTSNPLHVRNGGLIGLAGTAIALSVEVAPYMEKFVYPLLDCFVDPENRIRYFSAECLYNIAKVSKGEVLVYFNEIFDALSKLAADSELSVKNGAELLDRLLKDIVAESASVYIPMYQEKEIPRDEAQGVVVALPEIREGDGPRKAFSLAHFIPLLRERIYVVSPFTRSYLVSWLTVLDSVPELELISYLPEFLDGLLKYLSDPTEDVRVATETLLADLLRELREVSSLRKRSDLEQSDKEKPEGPSRRLTEQYDETRSLQVDGYSEEVEGAAWYGDSPHRGEFIPEDPEYIKDDGVWIPGQGVNVDFSAVISILIDQLDGEHDEIQQSMALRWLAELLNFASDVMVPFTPKLIPAILPNLAHHVPMIQSAAVRTNKLLTSVIQTLPSPPDLPPRLPEKPSLTRVRSPTPTATSSTTSRQSTLNKDPTNVAREATSPDPIPESPTTATPVRTRTVALESSLIPRAVSGAAVPPQSTADNQPSTPPPPIPSRPGSPVSVSAQSVPATLSASFPSPEDIDLFDYQATVNELTIQFLSEFEETRVAALKWLIMLHQKAPKKILAIDDGTFPALLKTLSDSSEEVIKQDLQLLAQISASSEETYFKPFMMNLLELFSTDRRLLEARGSLIIRQLCLNLNTERIYRALAEILEKEDDLEFASVMVQKLNLILITSPELGEFRKRLKSLETRQDGQALFTTLYRSWCHNAVAVFSLCLLAQAYEHASNLLYIFADLEVTVQMLVQIDKLVQLIESPVFTYIRLQLLEPKRYPYLYKCLYGLLMLLPQSSAFVSLRNRLNAVNSAGFLHIAPESVGGTMASRSKIGGREEIKWQELLQHFRLVQTKHEKARRQALGGDTSGFTGFAELERRDEAEKARAAASSKPVVRRRVTGEVPTPPPSVPTSTPASTPFSARTSVLSPLNPRSRVQNGPLTIGTPQFNTGAVPVQPKRTTTSVKSK